MIYAVGVQGGYYSLSAPNTSPGSVHSMLVPPGSYQVYARATTPNDPAYFAAWAGGGGLITFSMAENSTIDINLSPPADPCNSAYWLPNSPDGRFPPTSDYLVQFGCITPTPSLTPVPVVTASPTGLTTVQLTVSFSIPSTTPPPVAIYVIGANNVYYTQDAPLTGINASYLFQVPPGDYQVYARSTLSGDESFYGVWIAGSGLATISVQPIGGASAMLTPPPDACDPVYSLPSSPDGRFPPTGGC
jgi:hypothetical protein